MADSTINDVTKMKVIDLRKELKSRGLPSTGDKAELIVRLQAALSHDVQDEHADVTLDSDEIDSDGVLDEDLEKSQHDLLEDSAVQSMNEELVLAENPPPPPDVKPTEADKSPPKTLKRKIIMNDKPAEKESDSKNGENKESSAKKIVLNRSKSITLSSTAVTQKSEETLPTANDDKQSSAESKIKLAANVDTKTRLELRAKRFGLPVKMSDEERKEIRRQRFGQVSSSNSVVSKVPADNFEKLKKRAERFGQSVSKLMTDIENKEKIERRKAKFGTVQ